jgi:hypothetical protein
MLFRSNKEKIPHNIVIEISGSVTTQVRISEAQVKLH